MLNFQLNIRIVNHPSRIVNGFGVGAGKIVSSEENRICIKT